MLRRGKFLTIIFLITIGCNPPTNDKKMSEVSQEIIGKSNYNIVYKNINDSICAWALNNLGYYSYLEKDKNYFLDSLLCFNKNKNKLVSCILSINKSSNSFDDGIDILYGEKINKNWFFFEGSFIVVPRNLFKNHNGSLSYQQLHEAALENVFAGYLTPGGEINENWFTSHFEHVGWGDINHQEYDDWCFKGKRYNNIHEYYQACHLCKVKANWSSRDTTQPIKQLPQKELE